MKHSHHTAGGEAPSRAQPKGSRPAAATEAHDGEMELQIREAAYYRYLARGAELGHDLEDWLQAESELLENAKPQDADH